jgi:DNA-binding SARP family transcriptional activator
MTKGLEFRLLGPLEVLEHHAVLALGGSRQRCLFAALLLRANEPVSSDRLIDALWSGRAPPTAAKTIQVYVSRLRKELGEGRLVTRAPGYLLRVDPGELDLDRFERLLGEARTDEPETAAKKLREALALWRGPALGDLAYEPFAQPEIARLEELRLVALEQRIEADLACGRHRVLIGELEALVFEQPLRERLRCHLMLALYRSGRQADALAAYRAARHTLSEELGLEPGAELRQLEQAILCQDPRLELPEDAPVQSVPRHAAAPERSVLVAPWAPDGLALLLGLAVPLAASEPPRELVIASVVEAAALGAATAALSERRDELLDRGLAARTAAFSSPTPGEDLARLASQQDVDLLLLDATRSPLEGEAGVVLERAPCDVAMLVTAGGTLRPGPVLVPFGAAEHDWAALELGAWIARATGAPLRLIGAASDAGQDGRDASRLLADASLIVQRTTGVLASHLLATPGRAGVRALADGAGLLVAGLSDRWRLEGLGPVRTSLVADPPAPTLLVRRGPRPGGLAPPETRTRFRWSLTAGAR